MPRNFLALVIALLLAATSAFAENDGCPARYPDGSMLRVGPEYADAGGLKYPDGSWLFVPLYYADHGRMNYPNGSMLRVGDNFADAGGFKYPEGSWLFVPQYYADFRAMKYPKGQLMRAGANYSNEGALFLENGNAANGSVAFSLPVSANGILDIWAGSNDEEFTLNLDMSAKRPAYKARFVFSGRQTEVKCRIILN